jgi:hypothetical protein
MVEGGAANRGCSRLEAALSAHSAAPFAAIMPWWPTNPESLELVRRLRQEIQERGDERLAMLLAGVELYVTLGREFELLEIMRTFAHEMHEAVEGTPTSKELEELFNREPPA